MRTQSVSYVALSTHAKDGSIVHIQSLPVCNVDMLKNYLNIACDCPKL